MKLSEELAYVSVMVKEGLAGPPARSSMFPGMGGFGTNAASQVSQQAKNRVEQNRNNAKQQMAPQGAPTPSKPGMTAGKADIPIPPTPTIPKITPQVKSAVDALALSPERLKGLRSEFEESTEREKLLRRHSKWWEDLSRSRAVDEDVTPGGYVGSALERMLPIPHTGTEAMVRLPLVGLGAYGGYSAGKAIEPIPSEELVRILRPVKGREKGISPLGRNIGEALNVKGRSEKQLLDLKLNLEKLQAMDPEQLSQVLSSEKVKVPFVGKIRVLPSPKSKILKVRKSLGKDLDVVRREIKNVIAQTPEESLMPMFKPYRWGGALAGLAGASALTGLPLAIRALLRKREGGEAAVRAKDEAEALAGKAEQMQALRERLLKRLPS